MVKLYKFWSKSPEINKRSQTHSLYCPKFNNLFLYRSKSSTTEQVQLSSMCCTTTQVKTWHKNSYARHLYVNKVLLSLRLGMFRARSPQQMLFEALSLVLCLCRTATSNKVCYFCQMSTRSEIKMKVSVTDSGVRHFSLIALVYVSSTGRGHRLSLPAAHNLRMTAEFLIDNFPKTKQPCPPNIYGKCKNTIVDLIPLFFSNKLC